MVSNRANINISTWDGTLSPSDFYDAARAFADKWKTFNSALPQWSWVSSPKRPWIAAHEVEGYLSLENVFLPMSVEENHDADSHKETEERNCSDKDEPTDNTVLVQSCEHKLHHYNFHIVYSSSYRVPVLYFQAYCRDGQPLALEDIEKDLPANSAEVLRECKWTFITQEEHTYLNRPWHTLHPCGTSEWMKLLLTNHVSVADGRVSVEQYLVSWFSVVGPVVGLKIPFQMLVRTSDTVTYTS